MKRFGIRLSKFSAFAAMTAIVALGLSQSGHSGVASANGVVTFIAAASPDVPVSPDMANIPRAFSYQGTLRLADGSLANGSYNITLRIYTAVTGGSAIHTESFTNTVARNGAFSVVVGDAVPIGATVFDNANLYLGITVAPDAEMLPRQRLFPVPWSMQAAQASTAITATTATTLIANATVNGVVSNLGAANTPAFKAVSSGGGWGSGIQFENTTANRSYGTYVDQNGIWRFGDNTAVADRFQVEVNGRVRIFNDLQVDKSVNVAGQVKASTFNGWCAVYPGGLITNAVFCNQDVAETFATTSRIDPGSLVVFIPEDRAIPSVRQSSKPYEGTIVGVVSTNPGLVFDQGKTYLAGQNDKLITDKKTVVAMIGRVPTKFSLENGPIAVGDPLTSGSTPGTAMKATQAGQIIGYAMQSSAMAKDGKILVWLQPGTYIPQDTLAALNALTALEARK